MVEKKDWLTRSYVWYSEHWYYFFIAAIILVILVNFFPTDGHRADKICDFNNIKNVDTAIKFEGFIKSPVRGYAMNSNLNFTVIRCDINGIVESFGYVKLGNHNEFMVSCNFNCRISLDDANVFIPIISRYLIYASEIEG